MKTKAFFTATAVFIRQGGRCLSALGGVFAKRKLLCTIAAWTLLLCSCFSPWKGDEATITLHFGNNRAVARDVTGDTNNGNVEIPTEILEHKVLLSGPGGDQTFEFNKGELTARLTVAPGRYEITVNAYLDLVEYYSLRDGETIDPEALKESLGIDDLVPLAACGLAPVDVIAGKNNPVEIQMYWNEDLLELIGTGESGSSSGATLAEKLEWLDINAESGSSHIFAVTEDESIGNYVLYYEGKSNISITLQGVGENRIISLLPASYDSMFAVGNGVTLILGDNITLNGHQDNSAALVRVDSGGTFAMNSGSKVTGNTNSDNGGGVSVNGTFTMTGGEISGNTGPYGGGVYVGGSGRFTMTGGEISGNTSDTYGGGVLNYGTLTLGGTAKIKNNYVGDGMPGNVLLVGDEPGMYITLGTGENAPKPGMEIWVKTSSDNVIVRPGATEDVAKYFRADDQDTVVVCDDDLLLLKSGRYISSEDVLRDLANSVNAGDEETVGNYYILTNDIVLQSPWTPIGDNTNSFQGTFDGGGFTISGLTISEEEPEEYCGLFGYIDVDGTVKNLRLAVSNIESGDGAKPTGGIAGRNGGTIQNCTVTGDSITGTGCVGGIVGMNTGTVESCYTTVNVRGIGSSNIGGVAGRNDGSGTVQNCYTTGNISGDNNVGGVVGRNADFAIVQNCYTTGTVTSASSCAGGIVGYNDAGTVQNTVALNSTIDVQPKNDNFYGRVVGLYLTTGSFLANNYAWNDMTLIKDGFVVDWPDNGLNNGEGIDSTQYNNQSWWSSSSNWDFDNVWEWKASVTMPALRNMPE